MPRIYNLTKKTIEETPIETPDVTIQHRLLSEEEQRKLKSQFHLGSSLEQMVQVKLFHAMSNWTWYLMNQDPDDPDYLWGIVKGFEVEMGSISLSELEEIAYPYGLKVEKDMFFKPTQAKVVWECLIKGGHI